MLNLSSMPFLEKLNISSFQITSVDSLISILFRSKKVKNPTKNYSLF